ncbi:MAG: hypothetical protein OXR73_04010 [Myxococcales bacterium]|nr:hypothetical protein [Myxococcales bacterium]
MKKKLALYVTGLLLAACGGEDSAPGPIQPTPGATGPEQAAMPQQAAPTPGAAMGTATPAANSPQPAAPAAAGGPTVQEPMATGPTPAVPGAGMPTAGAGNEPDTGPMEDPMVVGAPCDKEGLPMDGSLKYSPGGDILPKPCQEFHPTLNNPYAVRCIDAWPDYDSGYPGDELCILPPEPDKGIQVGIHPQGLDWYDQVSQGDMSGYQNVPMDFLIPVGAEAERNYKTRSPNMQSFNFYRSATRMRSGSHHLIVAGAANGTGTTEEWIGGNVAEGLFGGVSLPGAQRVDENVPVSFEKPPEDAEVGLYTNFGANSVVTYNMHYFNSTDQPLMREVWQNYWFEDDARTRVAPMFGLNFGQVALSFAQPEQTVDDHYVFNIGGNIRLIMLFGHSHVWTSNFSAWLEKGDGTNQVLYQSFDWFDKPTYRYDSVAMNPVPDTEKLTDGGHSGIVEMKSGDKLHFNCHMEYTAERAAATESPVQPSTNGALRFANQAYKGEMCILFGSTTRFLGTPAVSNAAVPDFASAD